MYSIQITDDPNCFLGATADSNNLQVPPDGEYGFADDEPPQNKDLFDAFEEVFSDPTKLPATGNAQCTHEMYVVKGKKSLIECLFIYSQFCYCFLYVYIFLYTGGKVIKPMDRNKRLMMEGMSAITFGVRKRDRMQNKWFKWKYREEIEVT